MVRVIRNADEEIISLIIKICEILEVYEDKRRAIEGNLVLEYLIGEIIASGEESAHAQDQKLSAYFDLGTTVKLWR